MAIRPATVVFLKLMTALAACLVMTGGWGFASPPAAAAPVMAPPEGFADPAIRARWQKDDGPVAQGGARIWTWGPGPFYTDYEPYSEAPNGNHLVQYFDKGRLEINNPGADQSSAWYVTSGLLVKEMVAGAAQVGDKSLYKLGPANIPVAGDTQATGAPTYAAFGRLTGRASDRTGQGVTSALDSAGALHETTPPARVLFARYEQASGHDWPDVFWNFANSPGRPAGFDWLYTLGYPITEPYWVSAAIGGKSYPVLVQLFERRTLTYNPANPPASQVEMGNVGRHYYLWRYADAHHAQMSTGYQVKVAVGPAPTRLTSVRETVTLKNGTSGSLTTAVFHAPWHHWDGVFTTQAVTDAGKQLAFRWLQGINLEVTLDRALPAGETATLELTFQLKPRPVGGRTGYDRDNDILCLGDALPALVPWENGGWAVYPYSDLGDLGYYDTSEYDIEIASAGSEKLVVGGTGTITGVNSSHTSWRFHASNVRDAAYVVSPRFINPLDDPSMTAKQGSVKVLAYFLPGHRVEGQRQLELVAPALAWFGAKIGTYPFDTFTVAEMGVPLERTDNYAQEYPMAYFVPTGWLSYGTAPGTWPWYTPVHETGHQWFYSTVGNNQLTAPWLDEAMTTYITAEYVRANYPSVYGQAWGSMSGGAITTRPVSSGVFSGFVNENQYTAAIYDTGVQMLNRVRLSMGDEPFYAALRDYYAAFHFKQATPAALLEILQKHSRVDLKPIFASYLGY